MKEFFDKEINRVAEAHYFLRPMLENALKKQIITEDGKKFIGNYENYYEFWINSFSDRFFDMGNMIRLGSVIEKCLKEYYMTSMGYKNLAELYGDSMYKRGIFQRVQDWQGQEGVLFLYKTKLNYNLTENSQIKVVQELMLHRHLYAHSSGLMDDDYIKNLKKITEEDLALDTSVKTHYPREDFYYFKPLERLNYFIEGTRNFFKELPIIK